ncbi:MAG TPA: electron transfer flavoprotein subunit beta/FixA family protein [Gaiellaceae bacterium]
MDPASADSAQQATMHAVVLLKQILDWELPPSKFRIDPETKRPPDDLGPTLLGPFEQNALELALQLRDAGVVGRITAVLAGPAGAVDALRKALALRCDEAVHVEAEAGDLDDPSQVAELLVAAIRRLEPPALVLAGRQAGDWDHGQVGYLVAERLGLPAVGLVWRAEQSDGRLHVWRSGNAGVEQLAVRPPALLTVTSHPSLQLRMGSVVDRMAANKKPITHWTPDELGLAREQLAAARRLELAEVWVPEVERRCELFEGEDPAEVVAAVLGRLDELKLLTMPA